MELNGWHEWIGHTNFSFKHGASHPIELVTRAAEEGYRGLAITDFDGVYGLSRSYQAMDRVRWEGKAGALRLFYGAELHQAKDHDLPVLLRDTLVLVATSRRGYHNLCRLVSFSHRDGKNGADLPLEHLLAADVEDLVAIQPMRGLVNRGGQAEAWRSKCRLLRERFGPSRFFLAVSRQLNPGEDHAIRPTIALAHELGAACLLSQDVFFHDRQQKDLNDLLHAIRTNRFVGDATEHLFSNGERSLHAPRVIEARYRHLPIYAQALAASRALAESCQFDLSELRYRYPQERLPEGLTPQEFLERITFASAREWYRGQIPEKIEAQVRHELALIDRQRFADYFLTIWDIVRWARAQGILCQGRGSAANSVVCYVLGITSVDPAKIDCLFERFISEERGDPPDIDVDFEHERREEVIQYIYERYGRGNAAMVANVITFQSRGALRAAGNALGIPKLIIDKAGSVLDAREFRHGDPREALQELVKVLEGEGLLAGCAGLPFEIWAKMAGRLLEFPSHLGIHSGGFVLGDGSLDQLVAQEPSSMEGRTVIQWCKDDIEALNVFKIDILGLGMLTTLRKCFTLVKSHYGQELSLKTIPSDDAETYDMICRADTVGTFQVESRAQMSMLPRLKPRCFYDLVIEVAIIRPGPIQGGMIHPYLRRRDGLEPVTYPDPRLEPILRRTMGIPIFQEQVMRIAMAVGGFTPGEANELRRNIGSFSLKGDVSRWIPRLAEGMRANGLPEAFITSMLEQLKGFASYGFPESHAASFAILAYASCYLKRHFPSAFFVALLNSQPMGFYSPHVLIQTARHLGVTVLPVCAQRSDWDSTLEPDASPHRYAIRMGFRLVRSLREGTAKAFVARRQGHGPWGSLEDFLREARLSRVDLTALAAADALRAFGVERRTALWLAEAAPFCAFLEDVDPAIAFAAESAAERMQLDFHATSTTLGPHPAAILKAEEWRFEVPKAKLCLAESLPKMPANRLVVVFGMVIVRQSPPSAKGMVFATLEDETGLINLVLTPPVHQRFQRLFDRQSFICAEGQLQRQGDAHSVRVTRLFAPKIAEAELHDLREKIRQSATKGVSLAKDLTGARNYH